MNWRQNKMKSITTILTLGEMLRKIACGGLVNSAVITISDGKIHAEGLGIESGESKGVDGTLIWAVTYPMVSVDEPGEIYVADIKDLLSKLGAFEKDDQVALFTDGAAKLVINRESPKRVLTYDMVDKKYIKTQHIGTKVQLGNPIILTRADGTQKKIEFQGHVVLDSVTLKELSKAVDIIKPTDIPLQITADKFFSLLKGQNASLMPELKYDLISGAAVSKYSEEITNIFNLGFGIATVDVGNSAPVHIKFDAPGQTAEYMMLNADAMKKKASAAPAATTGTATPAVPK